jgi:hypothetical protein
MEMCEEEGFTRQLVAIQTLPLEAITSAFAQVDREDPETIKVVLEI